MVRVLVVDDDADIRTAVAELLDLAGFDVTTAADGLEALEKARSEDHFSAIVLDLMMPRMNGWQFRRCQMEDDHLARVPVIAVTAEMFPDIDVDRVLGKPFDAADLVTAVRHAVERAPKPRAGDVPPPG
jgi:CheY-like chemotaxis protein